MSAQILSTPAHAAGPGTDRTAAPMLSVGGVLRSEWIKLWSLRSTYWTLGTTAAAYAAVVSLLALGLRSLASAPEVSGGASVLGQKPFAIGASIAMVPLLVLGILTVTGEYSTGQVRSSLIAVPIRLRWLAAKLAVLTASALVVVAAAVALSALLVTLTLSGTPLQLDLSDPETARIALGSALYLVTIMMFAFGVGALLRSSAAALGVVLGLLLVVETIVTFVAMVWKPMQAISPFLPGSAGQRLTMPQEQIDGLNTANAYGIHLSAWQGYGVLIAWVVLMLVLASMRLRSKDA